MEIQITKTMVSTCTRGRIDFLPDASARRASRPRRLALGLQDVPVLGDHQHRDEVDHSQS